MRITEALVLAWNILDFCGPVIGVKGNTGQDPRAIREGFQPILISCTSAGCGVSCVIIRGKCGAVNLCDRESIIGVTGLCVENQTAHRFCSDAIPILPVRGNKGHFNGQRGCFECFSCDTGTYKSRSGCFTVNYGRHSGLRCHYRRHSGRRRCNGCHVGIVSRVQARRAGSILSSSHARRSDCIECCLRFLDSRHSGLMRPKLPDFCSLMYNVYTSNLERGKHI